MALLASEWCGREGNRSVFNPLLQHFYKGEPGAAQQSDGCRINEENPKSDNLRLLLSGLTITPGTKKLDSVR